VKKKTKGKCSRDKAITLVCLSVLCLVGLIGIGLSMIRNDADYRIKSRTSILEKRQKNDTDSKKTVGWLRVQGTNIDYPVLYAPDYNFTYETEDFAWTEADFKELNNIVYISGHNIKNLSTKPLVNDKNHTRFEQLMGFTYYDFAKNNQFIQYTINGKDYLYRIFAVAYFEDATLDLFNKSTYSEAKMNAFLKLVNENTLYKYNIDVNANDKIISLDTCTGMFGISNNNHFAVLGRLLRDGEKAKLVKVQKTGEYSIIEDEMKGGDANDEA